MNRTPEYHKKSRELRIVSRPNGLYAVQQSVAEHGTREQDNWKDFIGASNLTHDAAVGRLNAEGPQV